MEKHYTLSKAAELLGVTTQTLRNWDNAGKIKAIRTPGNQRRIPEGEIMRLQNPGIADAQESAVPVATPKTSAKPRRASQDIALLMCKDVPVYDITNGKVLEESLLPGCMLRGTMDFAMWAKSRNSSETNFTARRLMQNAFGKHDYSHATEATHALSLSDCYWQKKKSDDITFESITPYLNTEWSGEGTFPGGSLSTLFVAGTRDKRWIDAQTLLKINSFKEIEPYSLCIALGLDNIAQAEKSEEGLLLTNFTSTDCFLETMDQSGYVRKNDDVRAAAVEHFKELAVALFVVDYLVENSDRHGGNCGFLRCTNTGKYVSMAPYYDFDRIWTGEAVPLPDNAWKSFRNYIQSLCRWALDINEAFEYGSIIERRANELLLGKHLV